MNDGTTYPEYDGMQVTQLAAEMIEVQTKLEEADKVKKSLQKRFDFLRYVKVPEAMEEMDPNLTSLTIDGVGRLGLTPDMWVSTKAGAKEKAIDWLMDNGHGALVQETINASALKKLIKGLISSGEETPEDLFNISPFTRASITKK